MERQRTAPDDAREGPEGKGPERLALELHAAEGRRLVDRRTVHWKMCGMRREWPPEVVAVVVSRPISTAVNVLRSVVSGGWRGRHFARAQIFDLALEPIDPPLRKALAEVGHFFLGHARHHAQRTGLLVELGRLLRARGRSVAVVDDALLVDPFVQ